MIKSDEIILRCRRDARLKSVRCLFTLALLLTTLLGDVTYQEDRPTQVHALKETTQSSAQSYSQSLSLPPALSLSLKRAEAKRSYVREERKLERAARRLRGVLPSLKRTFGKLHRVSARIEASPRGARLARRKLKRLLKRLEKQLETTHDQLTLYYQAPRALVAEESPATKRLREHVWALLHAEEGLYQVTEGRFCLRAAWRAEIARGYRALGMISLADEQARHARACPPRSTLAHKER